MTFNLGGFLIGRVVAQNQGITDDAVINRLSLFGGLLGTTPTGLIMTTVIARREAEDTAPAPIPLPDTPKTVMPDVIGKTQDEAKLGELGLSVTAFQVESDAEKGTVIEQTPAPGEPIKTGSKATLLISTGTLNEIEMVTVPNVVGQNVDTARNNLESIGFVVTTAATFDSPNPPVPVNTVFSQSPLGGSQVAKGMEVVRLSVFRQNPIT